MDDDLKAVVERLSQSATFAEETGRNRCDSILASDLRTLLSALRQRDEALEKIAFGTSGSAGPSLAESIAIARAILTGSETNAR